MLIRTEAPADLLVIDRLLREAFDTDTEANLVKTLRENGHSTLSLVACTDDGEVVGHVMFSPVMVDGQDYAWQGLAPLAVKPEYQKKGIADAMIRDAFETLPELGYPVAVVLGDPAYYAKFGFNTTAESQLHCQWPVPEEAFMVAELLPGSLTGKKGLVSYCEEFSQF